VRSGRGRNDLWRLAGLDTFPTKRYKTAHSSADSEPRYFTVKSNAHCAIPPRFDKECLFSGLRQLRPDFSAAIPIPCGVLPAKRGKNKEPTSGLEPPTCSLRVISQALQGVAGVCKCRISREVSFLWLALCCTVLRSRWCQSGVRSLWISRRRFICKSDSRSRRDRPLRVAKYQAARAGEELPVARQQRGCADQGPHKHAPTMAGHLGEVGSAHTVQI
jgi:hypothetical protein